MNIFVKSNRLICSKFWGALYRWVYAILQIIHKTITIKTKKLRESIPLSFTSPSRWIFTRNPMTLDLDRRMGSCTVTRSHPHPSHPPPTLLAKTGESRFWFANYHTMCARITFAPLDLHNGDYVFTINCVRDSKREN